MKVNWLRLALAIAVFGLAFTSWQSSEYVAWLIESACGSIVFLAAFELDPEGS